MDDITFLKYVHTNSKFWLLLSSTELQKIYYDSGKICINIKIKYLSVSQILFLSKDQSCKKKSRLLNVIIRRGDLKGVKLLRSHGFLFTSKSRQCAIKSGNLDIVKLMHGYNECDIIDAITYGQLEIFNYIKKKDYKKTNIMIIRGDKKKVLELQRLTDASIYKGSKYFTKHRTFELDLNNVLASTLSYAIKYDNTWIIENIGMRTSVFLVSTSMCNSLKLFKKMAIHYREYILHLDSIYFAQNSNIRALRYLRKHNSPISHKICNYALNNADTLKWCVRYYPNNYLNLEVDVIKCEYKNFLLAMKYFNLKFTDAQIAKLRNRNFMHDM